jgi:hypothetical protein
MTEPDRDQGRQTVSQWLDHLERVLHAEAELTRQNGQ